jgi:hypothetical protein
MFDWWSIFILKKKKKKKKVNDVDYIKLFSFLLDPFFFLISHSVFDWCLALFFSMRVDIWFIE